MRGFVVVFLAGLLVLAGCSSDTEPVAEESSERDLTAEEAGRLGAARFRNFDRGVRRVSIHFDDPTGDVDIEGVVDFRRPLGFAIVRQPGVTDQLVQWTPTSLIGRGWQDDGLPEEPPEDGWRGRELAVGNTLDAALLITLNLGGDRPENATLLRQNGARWLRTETRDGVEYDVMRGPDATGGEQSRAQSSLLLWVDDDGTMGRAEISVATAAEPVVIEFASDAATEPVPVSGLLERTEELLDPAAAGE